MIKKKKARLKRKPRAFKKREIILTCGNKKKKLLLKNNTRNSIRACLKNTAPDLNKSLNDLKDKILWQAEELKKKNEELKNEIEKRVRSEEQIHIRTKAMESTADGIFIIDAQKPNYPVIYANRSFETMTGRARREVIGQNYFLLYGAGSDPRVVEEMEQTMFRGRSFHGEMLNFQKDGKKYWNLLRIAPVRDSKGSITHYVGIQTDTTLIREKESEISEQREELLHVTRVGKLAEFVSSLAHEISQPLTAILSYAQAGQRMLGTKEPEIKNILQYIVSDDQRAVAVIHRLRTLLKKSVPEMKSIDINILVNETIMLIATDASVKRIVLKLELENGLPLILGDKIHLQQVLLNLISNSFEAMENSLDPREIVIHTSRKDINTIIVEVKDCGYGISEQNMPKIFVHFFTSKPDGLGMGLSISRSIVEAHGGQLDVKNNPDRGATFYFTIPVDEGRLNE